MTIILYFIEKFGLCHPISGYENTRIVDNDILFVKMRVLYKMSGRKLSD